MELIYQLVQSFSQEESRDIERTLGLRTNSRKLFRLFRKSKKYPSDKSALFLKFTGRPYEPAKDHLLRNELSLLRRKLEQYILEQEEELYETTNRRWRNFFLAEKLYRRNQNDLAMDRIRDSRKLAEKYEDWKLLLRLNSLSNLIEQSRLHEWNSRVEAIRYHRMKHEEYLKKMVAMEQSYLSFLDGILVKVQRIGGKKQLKWKSPEPAVEGEPTAMSRYFKLKGKAFASGGISSARTLTKALGFLEQTEFDQDRRLEWFSVVGQIASEYSEAGDFENAEKWFARVMQVDGIQQYSARNFLKYNYVMTLIKLKKYEAALHWINELDSVLVEPFVRERMDAARISCYMFLRNPEKLKKYLPRNFSSMDADVVHYYRLQYSIYFYLSGDRESAEREVMNLSRSRDLSAKDYEPLVELFILFYRYCFAGQRSSMERRSVLKLNAAFRTFEQTSDKAVQQLVPAIWVKEEFDRLRRNK